MHLLDNSNYGSEAERLIFRNSDINLLSSKMAASNYSITSTSTKEAYIIHLTSRVGLPPLLPCRRSSAPSSSHPYHHTHVDGLLLVQDPRLQLQIPLQLKLVFVITDWHFRERHIINGSTAKKYHLSSIPSEISLLLPLSSVRSPPVELGGPRTRASSQNSATRGTSSPHRPPVILRF